MFSAHVEPLNALLEDCSRLKELSKDATSFREGCTKLGAVGDEIKLAANNAAQKVGNEDQSLYLSKIFAPCHKEVSLATTLIEVCALGSVVHRVYFTPPGNSDFHPLSHMPLSRESLIAS